MREHRLPRWMKVKLPQGERYSTVKNIVKEQKLHTICTSGTCPNIGECWGSGTATFMILGQTCSRSCRFCGVPTGVPDLIDCEEPKRIAETAHLMHLKHCVITSVTRDDLADGGADIWFQTIKQVKEKNLGITVEGLIPDFNRDEKLIQQVLKAGAEVISHNLETVERLTPLIRSKAKYRLSLDVIKIIAGSGTIAKSGIMLGLGETEKEVLQTMDDLRAVNCSVMTIGQYLQPSDEKARVVEYITPEKFAFYEAEGLKRGFRFVESSPLVRSSYHAERHVLKG